MLPSVVLEVEPGFVMGARIDRGARRLERLAAQELEGGALVAAPGQPNFLREPEVQAAVRQVGDLVAEEGGRLGLLLPDPVVRVGVLEFETLPEDRQAAEALIRWRMKELLPFPPEEARLTYQTTRHGSDGLEVMVMAARHAVLSEYENAAEQINGGALLVLPASAALLPLLPEDDGAGQLLVHACAGWVTTAVVAGERLRAWRNRDLSPASVEEPAASVAGEAARLAASVRDHFQIEVERTWLAARASPAQDLLPQLRRAVGGDVRALTADPGLARTLSASERVLYERFGVTMAGLVTNSGKHS